MKIQFSKTSQGRNTVAMEYGIFYLCHYKHFCFLFFCFLFSAPLIWVLEWGQCGIEYCWPSADTEYAWEINFCHLKPLAFEGYLLLQHNWAHPDWYTFQGHTEAEDFIQLVFQYMFVWLLWMDTVGGLEQHREYDRHGPYPHRAYGQWTEVSRGQRSVGAWACRFSTEVISSLSRRCRESGLLVNVEWGLARLIENSGKKLRIHWQEDSLKGKVQTIWVKNRGMDLLQGGTEKREEGG